MTTVPEAGYLRRKDIYRAVQSAMTTSMAWSKTSGRFPICQLSIQGSHLHLIVEADDTSALSRGNAGLHHLVREAHQQRPLGAPRHASHRPGIRDRYHARALRTPAQVRSCIAYVLNNWWHHGQNHSVSTKLDLYATGATFGGWVDASPVLRLTPDVEILPVWLARTWLLRDGWRRHGLIAPTGVPG